jgi:predicted RNase H-like HicB family nuclease
MSSRLNVSIEKTDRGYIIQSSEVEAQPIQAGTIESLMQTLQTLISTYLDDRMEAKTTGQSLLQLFESVNTTLSTEEIQQLPQDGAEQHDHYLYGSPKRQG